MQVKLEQIRSELEQELENILGYWMQHAVDEKYGGFHGRINHDNVVDADAAKGLVLNARILWAFSAAYNFTGNKDYLLIAQRAFAYLNDHFADQQFGGFYWSVDKMGNPLETRKQVYGIAFCCYAFSEYHRTDNNPIPLDLAKDCFRCIEKYSFDNEKTGYLEAFSRDWTPVTDLRLSARDANEKKTMNTHLHLLEAYTSLYRSWPDEELKKRILLLLENFTNHIINRQTGHLHLFFDEDWNVKDNIISYGHDTEAAWLLLEAAVVIEDDEWLNRITEFSLQLANAAQEGMDVDGGLWCELEDGKFIRQKHWWPQAEAMVGFFNAWQLTGWKVFLDQSIKSWQFIQQNILDKKNGEWIWGIHEDGSVMRTEDKAGFWKCPYHNSRACIEVAKRIKEL